MQSSVEMGHATDSNPMRLCTQRLTLYAFYKQAHFGKCSIEKPSAADFIGSAKWYVRLQELGLNDSLLLHTRTAKGMAA